MITGASRYVQEIISKTNIDYTSKVPQTVIQIQSGPNGNYLPFAEKSIKDAQAWFATLGFINPQPKIDYVFGRTVTWLEAKIDEVAPGCRARAKQFTPDWRPVGSAALCGTSSRGGVYSHIVNSIVPGACCNTPDDAAIGQDLSPYPLDRYAWHTFPHETFHNWQQSLGGPNVSDLPNWMNEGAAQLFTYMLWAKLEDNESAYLNLDAEEIAWNRSLCLAPLSGFGVNNPAPVGCDYSKGMIAMEYFIYRFGVDGYIRLWSQIKSSDLNTEFQRNLGTSYDYFKTDLSAYLTLKGWGK